MAKATEQRKSQSPYVRHAKAPYLYQFKGCKHPRSAYQAVAANGHSDGWRGTVCASCNIIIETIDAQRRARAA